MMVLLILARELRLMVLSFKCLQDRHISSIMVLLILARIMRHVVLHMAADGVNVQVVAVAQR